MFSKRFTLPWITVNSHCQTLGQFVHGGWPRKSSVVPSFSGQIATWGHPHVGNLQLIYQQSKNYTFSQKGSCLFPTNKKPQIYHFNDVLAGLQYKILYVSDHDLHLQRVHMSSVQENIQVYSTVQHLCLTAQWDRNLAK